MLQPEHESSALMDLNLKFSETGNLVLDLFARVLSTSKACLVLD